MSHHHRNNFLRGSWSFLHVMYIDSLSCRDVVWNKHMFYVPLIFIYTVFLNESLLLSLSSCLYFTFLFGIMLDVLFDEKKKRTWEYENLYHSFLLWLLYNHICTRTSLFCNCHYTFLQSWYVCIFFKWRSRCIEIEFDTFQQDQFRFGELSILFEEFLSEFKQRKIIIRKCSCHAFEGGNKKHFKLTWCKSFLFVKANH